MADRLPARVRSQNYSPNLCTAIRLIPEQYVLLSLACLEDSRISEAID